MITIGIPKSGYSRAKMWVPFIGWLFGKTAEVINLDPDLGTNKLPENVDLILFDGGADVHPILYGGTFHKTLGVNIARDWNEMLIYQFYKNLPTLFSGICRGSQFLNVMNGGNLYVDLPSLEMGHEIHHEVDIIEKSSLLDYLGDNIPDKLEVNSFHHQAVKDLGDTLLPVLVDSQHFIVEGFESNDGKIRAVQSHPEYGDKEYAYRINVMDWLFRADELMKNYE